ncbi:unnamed protein product [Nippostrongylus brasiliensis]|uniref:Uncharacterized protein n=1 Tax=Nippostrongylus brasiliensis TaxID=27835 RepID=A0A0N4YIC1_NIPBR|nr:unnamed protein product [Nippostrongylus brasiliensis]
MEHTASVRFRPDEAPPLFRPHTTKKGASDGRTNDTAIATKCTAVSQHCHLQETIIHQQPSAALPNTCRLSLLDPKLEKINRMNTLIYHRNH